MKAYRHIIFDLDHTLWDFTANSNATLKELFIKFDLDGLKVNEENFLESYQEINDQMWFDYNHGKITKDDIRLKRFRFTLARVGIYDNKLADRFNEEYLAICPGKGRLIPFAKEILQHLSQNYTLHILTNGFSETQDIKIKTSGLQGYFKEIINSESCGFLKPDKRIFDYTISKINGSCANCIMIGDDLHADVLGAKNAGLDHVFFNRKKIEHQENILHEISCLSELKEIL